MPHRPRQVALPLDVLPPSVLLEDRHYLGKAHRSRWTYADEFGVMVWAAPTSRHLPSQTWLELVRWCLLGLRNGGSQQFARAKREILHRFPDVTTLVSYSDPSVGHTGAVYKACNWTWAPTWHRLKPPPSGNGSWNGTDAQSVKDRWIFALRPDAARADIVRVKF